MSRDLLSLGVMVRLASPIAHSLSQITVDNGRRLGVPKIKISQYLPLIQSDAGGGEDTGNFGLGSEGDNHGDARGMG
jgi:hypothetical protein